MGNWKGIVNRSFTSQDFDAYCHTLNWIAWRPSFIVLHNTYAPSLADRPNGFTSQHILNLQSFFRDDKKWSAGPHLFIDDKKIHVFTPLTVSGVHSPSWNKLAIGIEMLGNFEKESFTTGRGLEVQKNTIAAVATLCAVLGIDPNKLKLHKEDTRTTHDCPGKNVVKQAVINQVIDLMEQRHAGDHIPDEQNDEKYDVLDIQNQADKVKYNPGVVNANAKKLQEMINTIVSKKLVEDGKAGKNTSNAYFELTGSYLQGDPRK